MHHTALLLSSILAVLAPAAGAEPPAADELLDRAIAYHDPEGRFLSRSHRLSFLETRPGGPDRRSAALIDVAGGRFEIVRRGEVEIAGAIGGGRCAMTLDGRSEVSAEEREKYRLGCPQLERLRDYYTYLWGLPMKLRDPGTRLGAVTATTFAGRDVYGLRVTYDPGVGDDVWYVYFDRSSHALAGYRFYHDEAKGDGEYIVLDGELEAAGLRLPRSRAWYTHQGERHLGTDVLEALDRVDDPWQAFRLLVGIWQGEGSGFGNVSDVTHDWAFVLGGNFLELRTRSVQRRQDGPGDVHEDVGFLSRDTDAGVFVFRQFLSEGYVNTFEVTTAGELKPAIAFAYREAESAGGMRARMRLAFVADDEYEMVLDLATPGNDFAACQQMRMRKVR